jgi:hypothetical protein
MTRIGPHSHALNFQPRAGVPQADCAVLTSGQTVFSYSRGIDYYIDGAVMASKRMLEGTRYRHERRLTLDLKVTNNLLKQGG